MKNKSVQMTLNPFETMKDYDGFHVMAKLRMQAIDMANDAFVAEVIEVAKRDNINELFLLDEAWILAALKEKLERDRQLEGRRDLLVKALGSYGAEAQTKMVFEEFAELQKELCKHSRGKKNREEIAEEIADVRIMLEQMAILHECEHLSLHREEEKLERLAKRLGVEYGE